MMDKPDAVTAALTLLCKQHDLTDVLVSEKLDGMGYCKDDINAAIGRLHELDMLNPASVAEYLAKKYSAKGDRWISQKLKDSGLSGEVIAQAIAVLPDEAERAIEPAKKKWRRTMAKSERERIIKTASFLTSRGFSMAVCWDVAKAMVEEKALA